MSEDPDGWIPTRDRLPPPGHAVETKVDDGKGCRNFQRLKLAGSRLWFFEDGSMYVYYDPTHWREPRT